VPQGATAGEKERIAAQRERTEKFFDIPSGELVERNRYGELRTAPRLVRHIFENVAPRFADRQGGYTRIVRIGYHRLGDATEMCVIQFVGAEEGPEIGGAPSRRRRQADKRSAYNAKLRKERGGDKAAATATAEPKGEASGESPES
jgi:large subunit ribosomal protein L17